MAYPDSAEFEEVPLPDPGAMVSTTMAWLGAACSVALLGGMGWWGYDLATRDVREVPVIAALEGPSRIAPEDPGGFQAAHQGLSVTDVAEAEADPLPEQVTLAPDPVDLAAEDQPLPMLSPEIREDALRNAVNNALQDALIGQEPAPEATPAPEIQREVRADAELPRPRPRPEGRVVSRAAPAPMALRPVDIDLDPEDIAPGTPLAQLGAFDSPATATAEWDRVASRFDAFFADRQRVVQRAEVGGKIFFRLRVAPFDDLAGAKRFCSALSAQGADCIPVRMR